MDKRNGTDVNHRMDTNQDNDVNHRTDNTMAKHDKSQNRQYNGQTKQDMM